MLIGTGVDLVEVQRIAASIERYGSRFLDHIYTPGEQAYCLSRRESAESFAARFAAKEAGAKALGTGMQHGVFWKDLEVVRPRGQRPTLQLHGKAAVLAQRMGAAHIWLALTHGAGIAVATVHFETERTPG